MNIVAIVLAAGKGTRMQSRLPKVLHRILGKPMIWWTARLLKNLGLDSFWVVSDKAKKDIQQALKSYVDIKYIIQKKRLGTGHAVKIALPKIVGYSNVLILHGDSSAFFQPKTIASLINFHKKQKANISILTLKKNNSDGSGVIIRDKNKNVIGNIETKSKQFQNCEVNVGVFLFNRDWLEKNINQLQPKKESGNEYILADIINIAGEQKAKINTQPLKNSWEKTHINTPEQLKRANELAKKYLNTKKNIILRRIYEENCHCRKRGICRICVCAND